ncbi:MAG: glycosyltransferase family 2 protein [Bacteroidota bacterium]|jgi:glycosyltransferase involved in cell wall biosynthesis
MIELSVILITLNEEKNIHRCLSSLKGLADELLILDSFSKDKTKEIAESFGATVFQKEFEGYVKARREIESYAKNKHILAIDADEALSETLFNSILELKNNWKKEGYFVARKTNYCGTWIKHSGWYPDKKLRLYKKGSGEWTGKYVHEKFILFRGNKKGNLKGDLLHYSYYNENEHWERTEKYAHLSALELFENGKRTNLFQIYLKTGLKFLRDYIKNLGFLDGKKGFQICKITAWGTYMKYKSLKKRYEKSL